MTNSIRVLWRGIHGLYHMNFGWWVINRNSIVLVSISQASVDEGVFTGPSVNRFMGDARMSVHNISPNNGGVSFVISVDWGSPLDIVTDIVVMDGPAELHDAGTGLTWQLNTLQQPKVKQFLQEKLTQTDLKDLQKLLLVGDERQNFQELSAAVQKQSTQVIVATSEPLK